MYAGRLTKEDLKASGITDVNVHTGEIYRNGIKIEPYKNKGGYLYINIYKRNEDGTRAKILWDERTFHYTRKDGSVKYFVQKDTYTYAIMAVGVHRVVWAWAKGEVPKGMVVDHVFGDVTDNNIDHLQLLTPAKNLEKERGVSTTMIYCKLDRPRSYYEDKLTDYENQYEVAKETHNAPLAHKLRTNISQTRARLRFWDKNHQ